MAAEPSPPPAKNSDITISWDPRWSEDVDEATPQVRFFLDGHLAGRNEPGFQIVLDTMRRLPRGTSIVWWPDAKKMGSRPPGAQTVPSALYPKRWREFQQIAKERGITLSSLGYPPRFDEEAHYLEATYIEPTAVAVPGDIVLEWKWAEDGAWPVYSLDGRESGHGPDGLRATVERLKQYPTGARLRVRGQDTEEQFVRPPNVDDFPREFREVAAARKFRVAFEIRKAHWPLSANRPAICQFEWRNFNLPATPHDEVLYLLDGKPVGMGNAGFDAVLQRIKQLPAGAYLEYPQYHLSSRAATEEEQEKFDAEDPVPFGKRRRELNDIVKQHRLVVDRGSIPGDEETSIYLNKLLQFAVIVRDGAKPARADAVISWTQEPREDDEPAAAAIYFYNGQKTGIGTRGFLAVLKKLESLAAGATVRIDPISIRTQGPFRRAVVMRGQRHFELTGADPFFGLVDLLAEEAHRKRLHVELIPSKGKAAAANADEDG
ncbi:MAG: hypothetical protein K8T25_06985 [Planctomycetia bacterium]|nr:hypothetical protein [Planctomycetia bacterium]